MIFLEWKTKPFNQKSSLIFEVEETLSIRISPTETQHSNVHRVHFLRDFLTSGEDSYRCSSVSGFIFFVTFLLLVKIAIVVLLFVMQDEIRPTLTKIWNNSKVNTLFFIRNEKMSSNRCCGSQNEPKLRQISNIVGWVEEFSVKCIPRVPLLR